MINVEIKDNKVFLDGELTVIAWTPGVYELEALHMGLDLKSEIPWAIKQVLQDCPYTTEEKAAIMTAILEHFKSATLTEEERIRVIEEIQKDFDKLAPV